MKIEKIVLKAAVESLTDRAEGCFERAQIQHKIADTQRASAEKLIVLGQQLEEDAINLAGEIEMATGRPAFEEEEAKAQDGKNVPARAPRAHDVELTRCNAPGRSPVGDAE